MAGANNQKDAIPKKDECRFTDWIYVFRIHIALKFGEKKSISQYYVHFLNFTSECSRLCVSYTDDWLRTKGSFGLSEIK